MNYNLLIINIKKQKSLDLRILSQGSGHNALNQEDRIIHLISYP